MTFKLTITFILSILALTSFNSAHAESIQSVHSTDLKVINLRCESLINPLGIDEQSPMLSWQLASDERGQKQAAYQIHVAESLEKLLENQGELWDSGRVPSQKNIGIPYDGSPLQSGQRCFWRVRVWDEKGVVSSWSEPAWWETALLNQKDWLAAWISDGLPEPTSLDAFYENDPAPLFRKNFTVKKISRARLYIAGLGYYEAYLNGERVGDHLLDPGWTTYSERVLYSTYDVTDMLAAGENAIGVILGNGWYNPLPMKMWGRYNLRDHLTVGRPQFIAQIVLEFEDGSKNVVISDASWKRGKSAILSNSQYLGEVYDARQETPGWSTAEFDDSNWPNAKNATDTVGTLYAQKQPPIRVTKTVYPQRILEPTPGVYIFDMGQNFAGWARLRVRGKAGDTVTLRYGELLNPDSTLNGMTTVAGQLKTAGRGGPGAPDIAWQKDVYILKGEGEEVFTPRFTFRGFRYVEITGYPGRPTLETLQGLRLNSDVTPVGEFSCSNELFNRIYDISRWTFLSNMFSVQSDCPAREKFGYGGDIVPTCDAFMLNFDMHQFYSKVVNDFTDAAQDDGGLTETAPYVGIAAEGFGGRSGPIGWALAHPLLQARLYQYYGDKRIIERHYAVSRRWLEFLGDKADNYIISVGISDHESIDPKPTALTSTAIYYATAQLTSNLAETIGNAMDAEKYALLAENIKAAFVKKFLIPGTGKFGEHTQASQAFALYFDLVPIEERENAFKVLLDEIQITHNGHLSTGLFGTKFLLEVLTRYGRADLAYSVVNQKTFPGWGYMIENGATTLWEHWAFSDNTFSHNHPMFGMVVEWLYNAVAGIRPQDDAIGFDKIIIKPEPVQGLTWAKATYNSIHGQVSCSWKKEGDNFLMDVHIPVNASATIYMPAIDAEQVTESGRTTSESIGLKFVRMEKSRAVYNATAGAYSFKSSDF
jgi:alpha-L-rhamnosidase